MIDVDTSVTASDKLEQITALCTSSEDAGDWLLLLYKHVRILEHLANKEHVDQIALLDYVFIRKERDVGNPQMLIIWDTMASVCKYTLKELINEILTKEQLSFTYLNITAEIITNKISYNTFDKYSTPLLRSIRIIAY